MLCIVFQFKPFSVKYDFMKNSRLFRDLPASTRPIDHSSARVFVLYHRISKILPNDQHKKYDLVELKQTFWSRLSLHRRLEKQHVHSAAKEVRQIKKKITCTSINVIYMIQCKKCDKQYIGETKRTLHGRFSKHRQAANIKYATHQCKHRVYFKLELRFPPESKSVIIK